LRIDKNHLYHGAALLQIAEDPHFKAINPIMVAKSASRSAYDIHGSKKRAGVYLKYATDPTPSYGEYVFNFQDEHLAELDEIAPIVPKLFLALVCVSAREICCLQYEQLLALIQERKKRRGAAEDTYTVLVTAEKGKSFRVYMNVPGVKKTKFGELTISRNDFPKAIFE